jgi:hypothetical protein
MESYESHLNISYKAGIQIRTKTKYTVKGGNIFE